jgi:hypothetical protein
MKHYTCSLCGVTGPLVRLFTAKIGGKSETEVTPECEDREACWKRWDKANDFHPELSAEVVICANL